MRPLSICLLALVPVSFASLLLKWAQPPAIDEILRRPNEPSDYRSIRAASSQNYRIHLDAGQYARVELDQRDIDLGLVVRGPSLDPVEINASEWGREAVAIVARASGMFRVEVVSGPDDSAIGRYRIRFVDLSQHGLRTKRAFERTGPSHRPTMLTRTTSMGVVCGSGSSRMPLRSGVSPATAFTKPRHSIVWAATTTG